MAIDARDEQSRRILTAIASGDRITQRAIAKDLGIALGLANLLVRRLATKGYIRVSKMGARHVRYLMTSAGRDALASATRQSLANTVHLYTETRETIRGSLEMVSRRIEAAGSAQKRIVFYGAGDVAEIAFISLQATDLHLVGVVDDFRQGSFLGFAIERPSELRADSLGGIPIDHIVVASIQHADKILSRLAASRVCMTRVSCI